MSTLKSLTTGPAFQHFEEDTKGSMNIGKLADFIILSENPLEIAPLDLTNIQILETIKEDKVVYQKNSP